MKKFIAYLLSALVADVFFTLIQWIAYIIGFKRDFDLAEMLIVGYVFGLIYVPVYSWMKSKNKENQ